MIYVIGADFAGLRFANYLSDLSLDYFIFDKKPDLTPDMGDYIVLNNNLMEKYDLKRLGNSALVGALDSVKFHSPYGKVTEIDIKDNYSIYDKSTIEYLLYKKLQNRNKDIVFSARFFDYNLNNNNVFFEENGKGTLRKAEIIIGSDGVYSNVRDKLFNYGLEKRNLVYCKIKGNFDTKVLDYYLSGAVKNLYRQICPINSKEAYLVSSEISKESLDSFLYKGGWEIDGEVRYKEMILYNGKKPLLGDRCALLGTAGGINDNLSGNNFFESLKSVDVCFDVFKQAFKKNKFGAKDKFNFSRQNFLYDSLFTYLDEKAKKRRELLSFTENKLDKVVTRLAKKKIDLNSPYPFEILESGIKKKFLFF